jgi:MFS family permease
MPLSVTGTATALPALALGADQGGLQWAVNGFNIAFAGAVLAAGVLADRSELDVPSCWGWRCSPPPRA